MRDASELGDRVSVAAVRAHYDSLSALYLRFWGEHFHHGYFENGASPREAQVRLLEVVDQHARIPSASHVLDIGCGVGGSCRWLSQRLGCTVRGVSISPKQIRLARGLTPRRRFAGIGYAVMDANRLDFPGASFDAALVIECSEHLRDKGAFLRSCARIVRPGGRVAVCAWVQSDSMPAAGAASLRRICDGMLCPGLGSMGDYRRWLRGAGFDIESGADLSEHVAPTWDYCVEMADSPGFRQVLRLQRPAVRAFVETFELMRTAFRERLLRYGLFVARRIEGDRFGARPDCVE